MKIKICGLSTLSDITQVALLEPDYMGFIFYEKSVRFIDDISKITNSSISNKTKKVGVFVDNSIEEILNLTDVCSFQAVQLYDKYSENDCLILKKSGVEVIKAFGIDESFDFNKLTNFKDVVDYFLFDKKSSNYGGTGQHFDWSLLEKNTIPKPFFLAGGVEINDIETIKKSNIYIYCLDMNSRLEKEPGIKDIEKVKSAINLVRKTNQHGK